MFLKPDGFEFRDFHHCSFSIPERDSRMMSAAFPSRDRSTDILHSTEFPFSHLSRFRPPVAPRAPQGIARSRPDGLAIPEPPVLFGGLWDSSLNSDIRAVPEDTG